MENNISRKDVEKIDSHTYKVEIKSVTDKGVEANGSQYIKLCRGSKLGEGIDRQDGMFTEQLLEICAEYLRSVNVPPLANRDTSLAITHIEDALLRLDKRHRDRQDRGVLSTYKK